MHLDVGDEVSSGERGKGKTVVKRGERGHAGVGKGGLGLTSVSYRLQSTNFNDSSSFEEKLEPLSWS